MLTLLTQGVVLGFGAGTSFGALHNLLMNITLSRGWRYGLLVVLAPLLTDAPIILLMLFILEQFPPSAERLLPLIGGFFLLWLAWGAYQQYRNPPDLSVSQPPDTRLSLQTLFKGMAVNFLNPAPYIFWGAVGGTLLREGFAQSIAHGIAFLLGFYGTLLAVMTLFVFLFDRLRQVDPRITRGLSLLSVVVMTGLGLSFIWQGLR
jgi:threonine/homoserine/homoserine lactone efflux protein